jgi:alpha-1,3-rhamnosyl/mannosyltransferase
VRPECIRVALEAPAAAYRPSEAADIAAAASRLGLPPGARWFAYVGGFSPHKNVHLIVRAHNAIAAGRANPPYLLLVGARDGDAFYSDHKRIRDSIAASDVSDAVRWTGFVPDGELRHLLSGATALLLPSECEGFGLPAVEAAACGAPVIATTASPLPELLKGEDFSSRRATLRRLPRRCGRCWKTRPRAARWASERGSAPRA